MRFLDFYTLGLQLILPVCLLTWLGFFPLKSRLGFLVQTVAIGLSLLALILAAIWMALPWWLPIAFMVLWLLLMVYWCNRLWKSNLWFPKHRFEWLALVSLCALIVIAFSIVVPALKGRAPPSDARVVDLTFPLGKGWYLIANGGASEEINAHFLTLHPKTERQRNYRGQSYGVDIVKLGALGIRASGGQASDPNSYAIFGEPVLAPCDGSVLVAVDGMPDMQVPRTDRSRLEGNHVIIQCGDFAILLAHFQSGSVLVGEGETVTTGQPVGRVGNSGQSNEPHLHVHAQSIPKQGPLLSGEPYHLSFNGRFPVRNHRLKIEF